MKNIFTQIKDAVTLEKVIVRIIMAWILTSLCFFIKSDGNYATAIYAEEINTIMFLCYIVLFFLAFCALGLFKMFTWVETFGPTLLITIYGILSVHADTNFAYVVGLMVMLAISILYAINKTRIFVDFKNNLQVNIFYIVFAIFYIVVVGSISICRHLTFNSGSEGLGTMMNIFHSLREGFVSFNWDYVKDSVEYLIDNFSPVYYIFIPVYVIAPSPITLLVLQVIMVISGLIPVILLCRKLDLSKSAMVGFGFLYILYPAISCGCYTDLHESCLIVSVLLWLFYFIEKDNFKFVLIMSVMALLVCADAVIYVACIGLYMMVNKRKYIKGLILNVVSVAYYIAMVILLKKFVGTELSVGLSNYIVDGEGTILDVIRNFMVNPGYVIQECFSLEKLQFMIIMFLPLGFLPVCCKRISKFLLLLPMIIINLAPNFADKYSIYHQYAFGTSAVLIYMAVSNYADMEDKVKRYLFAVAMCASLVFLPTGALSKMDYVVDYVTNKEAYDQMYEDLKDLPEEVSVAASPLFVAHLSARDEIREYRYGVEADIIVLDCRNNKYDSRIINGMVENGYSIKSQLDNYYVILEKH